MFHIDPEELRFYLEELTEDVAIQLEIQLDTYCSSYCSTHRPRRSKAFDGQYGGLESSRSFLERYNARI